MYLKYICVYIDLYGRRGRRPLRLSNSPEALIYRYYMYVSIDR